jgi:hypothetical protein
LRESGSRGSRFESLGSAQVVRASVMVWWWWKKRGGEKRCSKVEYASGVWEKGEVS